MTSLTRADDGSYLVKAGADALEAGQVVVATGPFQVPFIPPVRRSSPPEVHQLHSADYRRPEQLPPGRVLVVGAANSGCQIAVELSATRPVDLAVGAPHPDRSAATAGTRHLVVGHPACGWTGSPPSPGWDGGWPAATRSSAPARGSSPGGTASRCGPGSTAWPGASVSFADGTSAELRRRRLGHRLHHRRLVDRRPRRHRRARAAAAAARDHPVPGPVHAGPHLAAHPRLGAAGLGRRRRRVPRRADRGPGRDGADGHDRPRACSQRGPRPSAGLRTPVAWGVVWGCLQAASPLAFFWLDAANVYALGLTLIAAVYIGFARRRRPGPGHRRRDGRRRRLRRPRRRGGDRLGVAARGRAGRPRPARTCGSTAPASWPTPAGGRRSAPPSTSSPPPSSPS